MRIAGKCIVIGTSIEQIARFIADAAARLASTGPCFHSRSACMLREPAGLIVPASACPSRGHATAVCPATRPRAAGKFLRTGDQTLWVRGVTYGPFRPGEDGSEFPDPQVVARDLSQMAAYGFNVVRTYTVPPRWLLDAAREHGLRIMVGLAWEQHLAFLRDRARARAIEERIRAGVRACAGHPAVLCYAVGNEIPASIVRWHGARRVERYIRRLFHAAKEEDPAGLVTYVNYPTTEYLQLPFLDVVCFNVFLESQERFEAYVARLQHIAGDRPLLITELGLDTLRHGAAAHDRVARQIRAAFAAGCAGVCVFAWTDEWHRGGHDIRDWAFGLTDRDRRPKPGLAAVGRALADAPFPRDARWPRVSVVVCSRNGSRTIRECLEGLRRIEYPDYEVIVVNDGSQDDTGRIARGYGVRLINTGGVGLSVARNIGLAVATGEIVAYLDDDAAPDQHWLSYLAATFLRTSHAGVGGPNISPATHDAVAECIAEAPGAPMHVLRTDEEAEHIPGCNAAFRKAALAAIGGFDARFRVAGDDVDVCWRIQEAGGTLGFSPGAMVWHSRRTTLKRYWTQQVGYGKAEALLERKWPQKYNAAGHLAWSGRLYDPSVIAMSHWSRGRIYQGTWGLAPYQSLYQPRGHPLWSLLSMPEWYVLIAVLAGLAAAGALWAPLRLAVPLLICAVAARLLHAAWSAASLLSTSPARRTGAWRARRWALMTLLYLIQPAARLYGRIRNGLTPWRRYDLDGAAPPWPRVLTIWSERWRSPAEWCEAVEAGLAEQGAPVRRGGQFDGWDLEAYGGTLGGVRLRLAIEEHGAGRQQILLGVRPWMAPGTIIAAALSAALAAWAAADSAWGAGGILGVVSLGLILRAIRDSMAGAAAVLRVVRALGAVQGDGLPVPAAKRAIRPSWPADAASRHQRG
jgi:GT2 family glycosyltransferase